MNTPSKFMLTYRAICEELKGRRAELQREYLETYGTILGFSETDKAKSVSAQFERIQEQLRLWRLEKEELNQQFAALQIKAMDGRALNQVVYRRMVVEEGLDKKLAIHNQRIPVL